MKNKLAIFDLDGTLFDTDEVNFCSYRDALAQFGIELKKDLFEKNCKGKHYTEFLPELMGKSEDVEAVHKLKKVLYHQNLSKARENRPLIQLIQNIKSDYWCTIVTTASRRNVKDILTHFECENLFDYVVSQEDVKHLKPDPEGFLLAMRYYGVDAENTIIFEDSQIGISAARLTGATVFVVDSFA